MPLNSLSSAQGYSLNDRHCKSCPLMNLAKPSPLTRSSSLSNAHILCFPPETLLPTMKDLRNVADQHILCFKNFVGLQKTQDLSKEKPQFPQACKNPNTSTPAPNHEAKFESAQAFFKQFQWQPHKFNREKYDILDTQLAKITTKEKFAAVHTQALIRCPIESISEKIENSIDQFGEWLPIIAQMDIIKEKSNSFSEPFLINVSTKGLYNIGGRHALSEVFFAKRSHHQVSLLMQQVDPKNPLQQELNTKNLKQLTGFLTFFDFQATEDQQVLFTYKTFSQPNIPRFVPNRYVTENALTNNLTFVQNLKNEFEKQPTDQLITDQLQEKPGQCP